MMNKKRTKLIRKFANEQFNTFFSHLEEDMKKDARKNFFKYLKRQWYKDKWITLKKELKLLSSDV